MSDYPARLHAAIPGGAHTYSRGDDQFPSNAPAILSRGEGAYVWDPSGRRYLDYGMALRAVTLGYAHERVNAAAIRGITDGVNLTRATTVELEAAERLIGLIGSVDMVKFAKNGSNVTTAAVKIARACTGREYVCVPREQPFFSFDDWFIGKTSLTRGIPDPHTSRTLMFSYGDLSSLQALFDANPGQIAAVMMEPATTLLPCPSVGDRPWSREAILAGAVGGTFLHDVQALCRKQGALFILDEMITGFRWRQDGAQGFFNVEPDLTTFGKGMANGFSVAAVGGKREFMKVGSIEEPGAERTFLLSTTHGAEMPGMAAFIAAMQVYEDSAVVDHLWTYGEKLLEGLASVARDAGVDGAFRLDGSAICMNYVTQDAQGQPSLAFRTLFAQEMVRHGVLMPWVAVSLAHGDSELNQTLDAARKALTVYAQALEGGLEGLLEGAAIKPVFRRHN